MTALRLLRVVTVTTALLLFLAWDAMAVPFPSLTFDGSFPLEISTINPCDPINCEGGITTIRDGALPQFGLVGKTLLAAGFVFDIRVTGQSTTRTTFPFSSQVYNFAFLSLQLPAEFPEYTASDTRCNTFPCNSAEVADALVLVPGDALYSRFLGQGDVTFNVYGSVTEHGYVYDCSEFPVFPPLLPCPKISPVPDFPITLTGMFSGTFDVTYRYCTPGVDLGCPDAIPGFNSPIPGPATFFLLGVGFAGLAGSVAWRKGRRTRLLR